MPVPSVLWLAFSIFIGMVQAVIFTMLSIAYLSNSFHASEGEDHGHVVNAISEGSALINAAEAIRAGGEH